MRTLLVREPRRDEDERGRDEDGDRHPPTAVPRVEAGDDGHRGEHRQRPGPRQPDERPLRLDVGRKVRPAAVDGDAGDVDDPPPALSAHVRQGRLDADDAGIDIHPLHRLEVLDAVVLEGLRRVDGGVVDDDVEAADLTGNAVEFGPQTGDK